METLFSLGQLSRLLGTKAYRIAYAHSTGAIPEPHRFCGKRAYSAADVRLIAANFGVVIGPDNINKKENEACTSTSS